MGFPHIVQTVHMAQELLVADPWAKICRGLRLHNGGIGLNRLIDGWPLALDNGFKGIHHTGSAALVFSPLLSNKPLAMFLLTVAIMARINNYRR